LVGPIGDSCVPERFEARLQLDITWIERPGLIEAHRFVVGSELRPLLGELVACRVLVIEAGLLWCRYSRNIDGCATARLYVEVRDLIRSNDLQSDQRGKQQHDTGSLMEGADVQPAHIQHSDPRGEGCRGNAASGLILRKQLAAVGTGYFLAVGASHLLVRRGKESVLVRVARTGDLP
jgi:hypothetical protein